MTDDHDHTHDHTHEESKPEKKGPLSGYPMYRRGEGYITATVYQIDEAGDLWEEVSSIDAHGHQHPVGKQKISKGREAHILDMHRERIKMIEKHQKTTEKHLADLQQQKKELEEQTKAITEDIKVLETRVPKQSEKEEVTEAVEGEQK